jgi:hypothetical protein
MGYDTYFHGEISISPPLLPEHEAYLKAFLQRDHWSLDTNLIASEEDSLRSAVGLGLGISGEFYTGDDSVYETHARLPGTPITQPSARTDWRVFSPDHLGMRESTRTEGYVLWLKYLMQNFFIPWGYVLDGMIEWDGDDPGDKGMIHVNQNKAEVEVAELTWRTEWTWLCPPSLDSVTGGRSRRNGTASALSTRVTARSAVSAS